MSEGILIRVPLVDGVIISEAFILVLVLVVAPVRDVHSGGRFFFLRVEFVGLPECPTQPEFRDEPSSISR